MGIYKEEAVALENWIRQYCKELDIALSDEMPAGYEDAYGTFDICTNTVFLNRKLLMERERWEAAFFLFHELRHAGQYKHPMEFSEQIRESLPYVILYNGVCFKLCGNDWAMCRLDGEESWFTNLYLSLPYELDANRYAYQMALKYFPDEEERLKKLYAFWVPATPASMDELKGVFLKIDDAVGAR